MTLGTCPICGGGFKFDETRRGRRRIHCSRRCTNQAYRDRRSALKQAARQAAALACEWCGGEVEVSTLGPVRRWCSTRCYQLAAGIVRLEPLPDRRCALPECGATFTPASERTRCCCTNHGQILYNRESRADGRQKAPAWNGRRRANWKKREALKKGASEAESFDYREVFERDEWTCQICGDLVDPELQYPDPLSVSLDHVVPLSKGGAHSPANAQCSHLICNVRKGNREAA